MIQKISKYLETQVAEQIRQNIIDTKKEASGRTRRSVKTITDVNSTKVVAADHIGNLETGTPPSGYSKERVNALWKPPLVNWANAKPITPKNDGVKKSKYTLVERWTRGVAYRIVDEGSLQFRKGQYIDIFSSAVKKAVPEISKIAFGAINIELNKIIGENIHEGRFKN